MYALDHKEKRDENYGKFEVMRILTIVLKHLYLMQENGHTLKVNALYCLRKNYLSALFLLYVRMRIPHSYIEKLILFVLCANNLYF